MRDYSEFTFEADGRAKVVYTRGAGPGVLIMHELPGMVEQCVQLADYVAARGFTVFLPLLFGRPNQRFSTARTALLAAQICVRREILLFAAETDSPLTRWLRALAFEIRRRRPDGRGVGVIGMCLSGGFAINLMVEDVVRAAVSSQPGLPLGLGGASRAALGVSPRTLEAAVSRGSETALLCYRFMEDRISPPERFGRLQVAFGAAFEGHELPGRAHSVLTIDLVDQVDHPTYRARDRVVEFLRDRLA
jgi:dienelactone hydrolase